MKNTMTILFVLVLANLGMAQSSLDKWPAIKDFHTVISQTFHPAEEGNFEPVKARSGELLTKAKAVLASDIPAEFRTKLMLEAAKMLEVYALRLDRNVQSKQPDAEIMKELNSLHDTFHEIIGMCTNEKH